MTAELLVYALVAAGLIFWLRSILGTRSEDEANRPAPRLEIADNGKVINLDQPEGDDRERGIALIEELAVTPKGNMAIAAQSAKNGLIDITKVDRNFNVYTFLQAAQDAFVFVVESYAEGDRETLRDLLSPEVYNAFDGAIAQREKRGESVSAEIHAIQRSEVAEARTEGKMAYVTVRFWADETTVTRDENGEIVSGHPDKTTQMRDLWTFSRDLKSRDPRWLVVETREDGAEDNDFIPDTH